MPLVVLLVVLGKALDLARRALKPLAALVPDRMASGATTGTVLAIVLIALLCFLAGLLAQTLLAQRIITQLESSVLSKVPAYEYLKQASASVLGFGEMAEHPVVLARLGGAWRLGIQTDVADGGLVAVFVPNSPNSFSGAVFFLTSDEVRPANVPLARAIGCLRRCGAGSKDLLGALSKRAL